MADYMLTTTDNPFDPSTEWREWYEWDQAAGYCTTSYLARIVRSSDDLSEGDQANAINDAIDEIVKLNVLGVYKKVLVKES